MDEFPIENDKVAHNIAPEVCEFESERSALFSVKLKPKFSGEQQRHLSDKNEIQPGSATLDMGDVSIGNYNMIITNLKGTNTKIKGQNAINVMKFHNEDKNLTKMARFDKGGAGRGGCQFYH